MEWTAGQPWLYLSYWTTLSMRSEKMLSTQLCSLCVFSCIFLFGCAPRSHLFSLFLLPSLHFPQPPPKLPHGVFTSDFQDFVTKWWVLFHVIGPALHACSFPWMDVAQGGWPVDSQVFSFPSYIVLILHIGMKSYTWMKKPSAAIVPRLFLKWLKGFKFEVTFLTTQRILSLTLFVVSQPHQEPCWQSWPEDVDGACYLISLFLVTVDQEGLLESTKHFCLYIY